MSIRRDDWVTFSVLLLAVGCSRGESEVVGTLSAAVTSRQNEPEGRLKGPELQPKEPELQLTRLEGVRGAFVGRAGGIRVTGTKLATGASPRQAADAFRQRYAEAVGLEANNLPARQGEDAGIGLMHENGAYKFRLFRYTHVHENVPVHQSEVRVLVRTADNSVVWAGSSLKSLKGLQGGPPPVSARPSPEKSNRVLSARKGSTPKALTRFSEPELVIYAGEELSAPRYALRYEGKSDDRRAQWQFFADPTSGDILHVRDMVHNYWGFVGGYASNEGGSQTCVGQSIVPINYARVSAAGGGETYTAAPFGFFNLLTFQNPVTLQSTLDGLYFDVTDAGGTDSVVQQTVTAQGPHFFVHNPTASVGPSLSQVNAYTALNRVRDYVLRYVPDYPVISTQTDLQVEVNVPGCTAASTGPDHMTFCAPYSGAGFDYTNGAFPSLAYHEYGHLLIFAVEPSFDQRQYGEGMGDVLSMLVSGLPEVGVGLDLLMGDCEPFRTAENDLQFDANNPNGCVGATNYYECAELLPGIVWDIRKELQVTEPTAFHDILSALVINSILLHSGPTVDGSIAVDLLTLDDNDGNLANGTPHYDEICAGFAAHGIECPPIEEPTSPCASFCDDPITIGWVGNYQGQNLGTGEVCLTTTQTINGGNCGNMAAGRGLYVNGVQMTCDGVNWSSVPPPIAGGSCIYTDAGNYPWAFVTLW